MQTVKKKTMRCMAFLMALVVLTLNIQVKQAEANPFIGVLLTEELIALTGAVMAAGGITFNNQQDLTNAVTAMSYNNPNVLQEIEDMRQQAVNGIVKLSVSKVKSLFYGIFTNYVADYAASGSGGGAISTATGSFDVVYYQGYPVMSYDSVVKYIKDAGIDVVGGLQDKDYYPFTQRAKTFLNILSKYNQGTNIESGIDGREVHLEKDAKTGYVCLYSKVGAVTLGSKTLLPSVDLFKSEGSIIDYYDVGIYYVYEADGNIYAKIICEYGLLNGIGIRAVGSGFFGGTKIQLAHVASGAESLPYAATVNPINILDDTTDYAATVAAIGNTLGKDLTDDDVIGIRIPDSAVGITMPGVITGAGTGDVVVDPPIGGEDTETDKPADTVGWLAAILAALKGIIGSIGTLPDSIAVSVVGDGVIDYSSLKSPDLTTVFPFCIPFDFARAIGSLYAPPKAPIFELNLTGINMRGVSLFGSTAIKLDMSEYETIAKIVRWGIWFGFLIGLMLATRKFIKW